VSEYDVLGRIFRNSSGRRSINQREMHRTAIREAKMVVAVGLVESVRVLYMPNDRLLCRQVQFLEEFGKSLVAAQDFQ
jgi:hypothetical protein